MTNIVTYVEETRPIKQVYVQNATGYNDLIVNLTKNGKAIRIGQRANALSEERGLPEGEPRVHITVNEVDSLIDALQKIKAKGVPTSVHDLCFNAA